MYKKSLKIIFVIINIVVVVLVFAYFVKQDNIEKTEREFSMDEDYSMVKFPNYANNTKDYIKELEAIEKTSRQLHIPYVKRTYYFGSGMNYKNYKYSNNIQEVCFEANNLENSILRKNFSINLENGKIYSTQKYNNSIKIPKYSNVDFTVKRISFTKKPKSREGIFFIQTQNNIKLEAFYKQLSLNYNKLFDTDYSEKAFRPEMIYSTSDDLMLNNNVYSIVLVLIILQIIIFTAYIFSFSSDDIVYRLLGFSTRDILRIVFIKQLVYSTFIPMIIGIIFEFVTKRISIMGKSITAIAVLFIFETIFAYYLLKFINKVSISSLVSSTKWYKYILAVVFSIKGILLGIILLGIFPLVNAQYQYFNNTFSSSNQPYDKYATFYPYDQGYNEEINPSASIKIASQKLYPKMNKDGAIYIDTSAMSKENSKIMRNADVNPNYLKFNPLYDLNNKKIVVSDAEHKKVILIPLKYKKYERAIREYYRKFYKLKPHIILLKNDQPIYNTEGKRVVGYTYIDIKTLGNNENYNLFTGKVDDTLKIPLHSLTPVKLYMKYDRLLSKYNFKDNLPQMIEANSNKQNEKMFLENSKKTLLPMILNVVVLITISVIMIYLYFAIYGYDYAVKRINGVSYIRRSCNYWLMWIIEIVLLGLFQNIYIESLLKIPSLILFLIVTISDLLINVVGAQIFSGNALRRFLSE